MLPSNFFKDFVGRKVGKYADVAQSVEHVLGKDEVVGSSPIVSSIEIMKN
jgi:hypothetical protein